MKDRLARQILNEAGLPQLEFLNEREEEKVEELILFAYNKGREAGERQEMEYPRREASP